METIKEIEPKTLYFTFGQNHTDPKTGKSIKDCIVKVTAPSAQDCRMVMQTFLGLQYIREWAKQPQPHLFGLYDFYLWKEIVYDGEQIQTVVKQEIK